MSFSEHAVAKRLRGRSHFYEQVDALINWKRIDAIIHRHYSAGKNVVGRDAYSGLLLFKMLLIGIWKGLSDRDVEEEVALNLQAMRFCRLNLEDEVPDHSVLSRFRTLLANKGVFDRLLSEINEQLNGRGVLVKSVVSVDASLTEAPRKPRGTPIYEIAEDRQEDERTDDAEKTEQAAMAVLKVEAPGVDTEGRWLKKGKRNIFGYKQHTLVEGHGLVLAVTTTAANVHDSQAFEGLLDQVDLSQGAAVHADKAYRSAKHDEALKARGLKNRVHYRGKRGRALNKWQRRFNRGVTQIRYKIERTFGGIKKWFGAGVARYVGLEKTHAQHILEGLAYNLKRLPRLWMEHVLSTAQPSQDKSVYCLRIG